MLEIPMGHAHTHNVIPSDPWSLAGWRVLTSRGQGVVEVPAGGDAQFGEHLAEVPFDGAGADE